MSTTYPVAAPGGIMAGARRAERWLDDRGRFAWILATVAGFVVFWPIGLALLAYAIWSKRMFSRHKPGRRGACRSVRSGLGPLTAVWQPTGNAAFDAYKADTLRRLEDEQHAFEAFLQRLREAKDKSEFDAFMEERARAPKDGATDTPPASDDGRAGAY